MAETTPPAPDESASKKKPEAAKPTRAVQIPTPIPDDSSSIFPRPGIDDDTAVDFGQMPSGAGGSAALSHSQISGPLSGTSVVAWTDLMKARADEEAKLQYDSLDNVDLDEAAVKELLSDTPASEPPTGKRADSKDDRPKGSPSQEFIDLDEELARKEGKSHRRAAESETVLPNFPITDQSSSIMGDAHWIAADSSHINLHSNPGMPANGAHQFDNIEIVSEEPNSSESSAVDLGSESVVDLPFPIEGGSQPGGSKSKSSRSSKRNRAELVNGDSGFTEGEPGMASDSGLHSVARAGASRSTAWIGGGLIGGLTGVALCAAIWLSGAVGGSKAPEPAPQPVAQPPQPSAADTTLAAIRDVISQAKLDANDPTAVFAKLVEEVAKSTAVVKKMEVEKQAIDDDRKATQMQMKELNAQLNATQQNAKTFENLQKAAEESLKTARTQVAEAQDLQKKAEADRKKLDDDLKAVRAQLAAMKPAPTNDNTELTRLQEEREKLETKAKELETHLAAATRTSEGLQRTLRDLGGFVVAVRQKLQIQPDAKPAEVLTALESALATKPMPELGPLPPGAATNDPRADRAFHRGLVQYRAGSFVDAEREFRTATNLQNRDARYWYFLGLSQIAQGQTAKADESLRQGKDREQRNLPGPDAIDAMLERMPASDRAVINRVRGRG